METDIWEIKITQQLNRFPVPVALFLSDDPCSCSVSLPIQCRQHGEAWHKQALKRSEHPEKRQWLWFAVLFPDSAVQWYCLFESVSSAEMENPYK